MKIVVDTNVMLNAILPTSGNYWIFENIIQGNLTLCVSNEIISEYAEIFGRFYPPTVTESFLYSLLYSPFIEKVDIYYHWNLIKTDKDDDKFVDCALASNAHFIVTNDRHFKILSQIDFPKITSIRPSDFKKQFHIQ